MKAASRFFSTDVELQCKVFWGPEARFEFSGTAVAIDSSSVALKFHVDGFPHPSVGERVELEVSLPVSVKEAGAKILALRAEVVRVTEAADGWRQLDLSFRKAAFRDVENRGRQKSHKGVKPAVVQ
jgi:hypothetical protein